MNEKCYAFKSQAWEAKRGERAIILSGVSIGRGAVIGAGSIVRNDVPPYAIYVNDCVKK